MKDMDNLERWNMMTDEELLSKAKSSDVEVPVELSEKIDSLIRSLDAQEQHEQRPRRARRRAGIYSYMAIGLAAASLAVVIFLKTESAQPKDTFSSPEEAYAQLESTFAHIAIKTGAATSAFGESVQHVEDTFTKVYR